MNSDPVIVTRLGPRLQSASMIVRVSLLDHLTSVFDRRLIVIEAPAGYGKTNLLSQWRDRLLKKHALVGWLTLDPDDRDAGDFLLYILHALRRGGLRYEAAAVDRILDDKTEIKRHLRLLLNAIAAEPQPVFLILDEFEHVSPEALELLIRPILRLMPDNLSLVFAARKMPDLKLSVMHARGLVHILSASDLRFSRSEIELLFTGTLSQVDMDEIEHHTAGWPVMLQLLKGAQQEAGGPSAILRGMPLTGTASDYLSEQVLSELHISVQEALVQTAPLDAISRGAFEAVLGSDQVWPLILQDPVLRPFLASADDNLPACKVHPIVRRFLREQFDKLPDDDQRLLLSKAAGWYAWGGRYPKALRLAVSAGNTGLAGKIVEDAGGVQLWIRKGHSLIKQLDEMLSEEILLSFPRLLLMRTLVRLKVGKIREARALYETARLRTKNFTRDRSGGSDTALRLDSMIVEATLLINECRAPDDGYLIRHEDTIRSIAGGDDIVLGNAKIALCLVYHQKGRFDISRRYAEECADHYRRAGVAHGEFFARLHKGAIEFATGNPTAALAHYQEARGLWHRHFEEDRRKLALIAPLTMEVNYETGTAEPALKKLRESNRELGRSEGWFDIFASEYTVTSMTALFVEGLASAMNELECAQEEVAKRQVESVERLIHALRASCLALTGDLDAARQALTRTGLPLEAYDLSASTHISWREREAVLLAASRIRLRAGEPEKVADSLTPMIGPLQASGAERTAVRFGVLLGLAHWRAGNIQAFTQALEAVLLRVNRHGYVRGFLEEGPLALEALNGYLDAASHSSSPDAVAVARGLLEHHASSQGKNRANPLTPREQAVLEALVLGHADKVIARELGMTHNTVRYHLKNVFHKLGTHTRLDTIMRAKSLHLLGQ